MTLENKVQEILDNTINPQLATHSGSARITGINEGVVSIKFLGACAECMAASDTFDSFVKATIMEQLPEVEDVVADDSVDEDLLEIARKILKK